MQFLQVSDKTKLTDLANIAGDRNVEYILAANDLQRTPNIGKAFKLKCDEVIKNNGEVSPQRKITLLNTLTSCSDVFETACLLGSTGWKVMSALGTFPNMLKIPESITLPDSVSILGNGVSTAKNIYDKVMICLKKAPYTIDPSIFNEYSTVKHSTLENTTNTEISPFQGFHLPWGEISLYSSLGGDSIDFPVYPEELSDEKSATYDTMPDMLYQYEPWQVYKSSGPRANTYTFKFHRDMWTGDHRDGKANELIRFCEANCYPEYNGSAVNTAIVTLYLSGKPLITGVMTNVKTDWDGPIGLDGFYLHCTLQISITEVSEQALNYNTVRRKGLIG